jgi:multidrug resistance efflux pump
MSPVVEIAPVVDGTLVEVMVKTHQVVKDRDVLFTLDKRPFELAVQQAQANYDITEVTFKRTTTANKNRPGTFSDAKEDENRTQFQAASAILEIAKYNLDRTQIKAIGEGILGAVRVAEAALAHKAGSDVEQACRRSDELKKRRKLMEAWADYCIGAKAGKVVNIHA